jgi:uncharacterized delta-60 repeat protein
VGGIWQLDPSFAGDGKFIWSLGGGDSRWPLLVGVKVMDDGRIVAAGNRNSWQDYFHVPFVSRLLAESSSDETAPDPSFGIQGLFLFGDSSVWHDIGGFDVGPKGEVVAGGVTIGDNGSMLVFRLLENGQLDPSFAGTGWRTVEVPNGYQEAARAVAIAPDGSIDLAGEAARNGEGAILVVRLLESGELDPAFGTGGYSVIVSNALGTVLRANAVAVQGDGRAVVAGEDYDGDPHFLAMRLTPDGALDPSFGSGGIASLVPTQPGVTQAFGAWDMAMQPDGRILLLGSCRVDGIYGACIARLENDYVFADGFEGGSTRGWSSVCLAGPCPEGPRTR